MTSLYHSMRDVIKYFSEIRQNDIGKVGGKGANLATLAAAGFLVPPGFCITTQVYREFLRYSGLEEKIAAKIVSADLSILENIRTCGAAVRQLIMENEIPEEMQEAILAAYRELFQEPTPPGNTPPNPPSRGDLKGGVSQGGILPPTPSQEGNTSPYPSQGGIPTPSQEGKLYVAVRSSATAEDLPDLSFAGQHDTYLNISGEADLLFYVKKCWASLWSDRAIAYRRKNNLDHLKVLMAVVVQQMVSASVSGITFTANPVTHNRHELVINANWGLGESVVSGKASPDEYTVDKEDLTVKNKNIAEKTMKTMMITLGDKGAVEMPVPEAPQTQPCLADTQIQELAAIGKQIEAHFGAPQDIEWGFAENHLYILQSRPITTLPIMPKTIPVMWANSGTRDLLKDKVVFWSNFNVGETMPYPFFPLSWSYWAEILLPLLYKHFWRVTQKSPLYPYQHGIDLVYGRIYWNMNIFYGHPFFGPIFKQFLPHIDREAGKLFQTLYKNGELQPVESPKGITIVWFLLSNLVRVGVGSLLAPRILSPPTIQRYWQDACEFEKLELQGKSNQELLTQIQEFSAYTLNLWISAFLLMGHAFASCGVLEWLIKKWHDVSFDKLLAGIPGNNTTEGALELYQLSQMPDALKQVFLTRKIEELPAILGTSAEGRAFLQRLERFMDLYGHRAPKEFDIGQPRWKEDPTFVFQMIKNYLQLDRQDTNPVEHFQQTAAERERVTELVRQRLSQNLFSRIFPVKRWLFTTMLKRTHKYMPWRENPKYYFLKFFSGARRIFSEIGHRLCTDGYLETPEDVYFLTLPELETLRPGSRQALFQAQRPNKNFGSGIVVNDGLPPFDSAQGDRYGERGRTMKTDHLHRNHIRTLVCQRQAEWRVNLAIDPPFVVRSDGKPVVYTDELPQDARILHGTPISGGKVTGKARIILDPAEGCAFNKGEILVAPYTDPGWTPLFLTAKALVMEVGGVMCHGAIVAREYGIPAVIGVKYATKIIHTGDEISVDGDQGRILL